MDNLEKPDRLFVPLSTGSFSDFLDGGKQYEVRAYSPRFSDKTVYTGRAVELRKGYSGRSLWGRIGEVYAASPKTLGEIFSDMGLSRVEPRAASLEEAVKENTDMLGQKDKYILFQVLLEKQ